MIYGSTDVVENRFSFKLDLEGMVPWTQCDHTQAILHNAPVAREAIGSNRVVCLFFWGDPEIDFGFPVGLTPNPKSRNTYPTMHWVKEEESKGKEGQEPSHGRCDVQLFGCLFSAQAAV